MINMKELFYYTLKEIKESEVTETLENGDKVIKKVKSESPVKVIIKSPSRSEINTAQDIYNREWSRCVREGIVTRAIIDKTYRGQKGFLTDEESDNLSKIQTRLGELQKEYNDIQNKTEKTDKDNDEILSLLTEFDVINNQLSALEDINESLYVHTAENISYNKQLTWNVMFLTYLERDGKIQPLIHGDTLEEKLSNLDKVLEDESSDESKQKSVFYSQVLDTNTQFIKLFSAGKIQLSQFESIRKGIEGNPVDEQIPDKDKESIE